MTSAIIILVVITILAGVGHWVCEGISDYVAFQERHLTVAYEIKSQLVAFLDTLSKEEVYEHKDVWETMRAYLNSPPSFVNIYKHYLAVNKDFERLINIEYKFISDVYRAYGKTYDEIKMLGKE